MRDVEPVVGNKFGPFAQAVEELLPLYMMSQVIDDLYKRGYEIRLDTRGYLNNAMVKALKRHPGQEMVVARKADDIGRTILKHVGFDDTICALLAVSMLILKLVEENLYLDKDSQAVLSAIMILADAREDENEDMAPFLPTAEKKAGRMLNEVLSHGLFNHAVIKAA